jgi:hypothetical protein
VTVSRRGHARSIWFSLPLGRHAYRWVLDGCSIPDPRHPCELGLSPQGPFSTVAVTYPSRWLRVRNPWRHPARISPTPLPQWLRVRSNSTEVPAGGFAELELRIDATDMLTALDEVVELRALEAANLKSLAVSARVRARVASPVPVFLPGAVRWSRAETSPALEVTGTAFGPGGLRMTLRDCRTLRVLGAAELQCSHPVHLDAKVAFSSFPASVTKPAHAGLILDTGSLLENRRRFLLSLPEAPDVYP